MKRSATPVPWLSCLHRTQLPIKELRAMCRLLMSKMAFLGLCIPKVARQLEVSPRKTTGHSVSSTRAC